MKQLVAMLHLEALPGAPCAMTPVARIAERAQKDARRLIDAGFDAVLIENFGDRPFHRDRVPAVTIAAMTVVTSAVVASVGTAVGVNVLRNDARAALAIAHATGASFIRVNVHTGAAVTDQGIVQGRADQTLRLRAELHSCVRILADVHVKHAVPLGPSDIAQAARDCADRGLADGLIVSGTATGAATAIADLERVKAAVPDVSVWVGSGVDPDNVAMLLGVADGAIIGTCLERGGRAGSPLDWRRVGRLLRAAERG